MNKMILSLLLIVSFASCRQLYIGRTSLNYSAYGTINDDRIFDGFAFMYTGNEYFQGTNDLNYYVGTYENERRKGYGQFTNQNNSYQYRGGINQVQHGYGVQHITLQDYYLVYLGQFEMGKYQGEGLLYNSSSKEVKIGQFKNNQFVNGHTVYEKPLTLENTQAEVAYLKEVKSNGDKWWYTYRNGKVDGPGSYGLKTGESFWGHFIQQNGHIVKTGNGVVRTKNGWVIRSWNKGVNPGLEYYHYGKQLVGQWIDDTFVSGQKYELKYFDFYNTFFRPQRVINQYRTKSGGFFYGKLLVNLGTLDAQRKVDGFGIIGMPNYKHQKEYTYRGTWRNNDFQGYGMLRSNDGKDFYRGGFWADQKNGYGVQHKRIQDYYLVYLGQFKMGKYQGEGLLYNSSSKEVKIGQFKNNQFVNGHTVYEKPLILRNTQAEVAYLKEVKPNGDQWWYTYRNGKVDGPGSYGLKTGESFWGHFKQQNGIIVKTGNGVVLTKNGWVIRSWNKGVNPGLKYQQKGNQFIGFWKDQQPVTGHSIGIQASTFQDKYFQSIYDNYLLQSYYIQSWGNVLMTIASNF